MASVRSFIFSGFGVDKAEESTVRRYIEKLGGSIVDRDKYTFLCTHVIAKEFQCTEKVLAALAAGKWILKPSYVLHSYQQRQWLDEKSYEVTDSDGAASYCRKLKNSSKGGIYHGWTFFVVLEEKNLTRSCRRIITAGEGEILSETELSRVNAVISEPSMVRQVRSKVGPLVPIINFVYIKDTLIGRKDPRVLKNYMLDGNGSDMMPERVFPDKTVADSPVVIMDTVPPSLKRPAVETVGVPTKKHCAKGSNKCPPAPCSKQPRIDQFVRIETSSGSSTSQSLSRPSTSKHMKRKGMSIPFSPEKHSMITQYFVKKESGYSVPRVLNTQRQSSKDDIEVIREVYTVDSIPRRNVNPVTLGKDNGDNDCFITKVEKSSPRPHPENDNDCIITKVEAAHLPSVSHESTETSCTLSTGTMISGIEVVNSFQNAESCEEPRECSDLQKTDTDATPQMLSVKKQLYKDFFEGFCSLNISQKPESAVESSKFGDVLSADNNTELQVTSAKNGLIKDKTYSLPEGNEQAISNDATSVTCDTGVEGTNSTSDAASEPSTTNKVLFMSSSLTSTTPKRTKNDSELVSISSDESFKGFSPQNASKVSEPSPTGMMVSKATLPALATSQQKIKNYTENVSTSDKENRLILQNISKGDNTVVISRNQTSYMQKKPPILEKEEIEKLPADVNRDVNPRSGKVKYTTNDLKNSIKKFVIHTKEINSYGNTHISHASSYVNNRSDIMETFEDGDLSHVFNPLSSFCPSTGIRELTLVETALYESSTDEDTLESHLSQTEKGIIVMGLQSLHLGITPFSYPPPSNLGHLLQKIVFEVPFSLASFQGIEMAYQILRNFPPVNSFWRNYYAKALECAAKAEKNFCHTVHFSWRFLLRSIEVLQKTSTSLDESFISDSSQNDVDRKEISLELLKFIVALLNKDLQAPNYGESVRDHLTWRVFWTHSKDVREITPPVNQLLRHWISMIKSPENVRFCMAKLVAVVMELLWRYERPLLGPISPLPDSLTNFANVLRTVLQECCSKSLLQLQRDLPTPWARTVFGSIIFQSDTQNKAHTITLGNIMEYGLLISEAEKKPQKSTTSADIVMKSPRKKKQKNINKRNGRGETKLMLACMKGDVEAMKVLLAVPGIDVNLSDHNGWTPLHEAAVRGHSDCVKTLLQHNGSDSADIKSPLHLYLRSNYFTCDPFAQSSDGQTALHDAVKCDFLKTSKILLDYGGDALLKIENKKKETALMLCGSNEMHQLLQSHVGKAPRKGSQKLQPYGKSSIFVSGLSGTCRFLTAHEDRLSFVLTFANDYLEASGTRFCQYDMMLESFKVAVRQKIQNKESSNKDNLPLEGQEKSRESDLITLTSSTEAIKLTDSEMEIFDQLYDSTYHNLKLCIELTPILKASVSDPGFVTAIRNLF